MVKPISILLASLLCLSGCDGKGVQTHGVFVTVETECEAVLESVEVVFGTHSEYCGSIARGGGYTIVGVEYPVLLEDVEIRFQLDGEEKTVEIPLRRVAPRDLDGGGYEVVFNVVCGSAVDVQTSFWRYVKLDGKTTKEEIVENVS